MHTCVYQGFLSEGGKNRIAQIIGGLEFLFLSIFKNAAVHVGHVHLLKKKAHVQ